MFNEDIFYNLLPHSFRFLDEKVDDTYKKDVPVDIINSPNGATEKIGQLQRMLRLAGVEAVKLRDKITKIESFDDLLALTDETVIDSWLSSLEFKWYGTTATLQKKQEAIQMAGELNQRRGRFDALIFVVNFVLGWTFELRKNYERVFRANDLDVVIFDSNDTARNDAIKTSKEIYQYFFEEDKYDAGLIKLIINAGTDDVPTRATKLEALFLILDDWLPFGMKFKTLYEEDLTIIDENFDNLDAWILHAGSFSVASNQLNFSFT